MITAEQALNAMYYLEHAAKDAIVMHYVADLSESRCAHKSCGLEENFKKAAHELGFELVPISEVQS